MDALIVPLFALVVYWLTPAPSPTDHVVLLPEPDGKIGALVVKSAAGERVLDTPYAGVAVDNQGAMVAVQEDATSSRSRRRSV